jgi:secreted PhoX family phosphatase
VSTRLLDKGHYARMGNNQMLAADPITREVRRFLTGPTGCEITGVTGTPDGRTLFVNVQHPGEAPSGRSNPNTPGPGPAVAVTRPGRHHAETSPRYC